MIDLYDQVRKIFITLSPILDMDYVPTYDESDDEIGDEQIDTTDMPDFKNEESAEQGQGLKILTPQQMLSRLPIGVST